VAYFCGPPCIAVSIRHRLSLRVCCSPWWLHWYCHDLVMEALCWLVCQSSYSTRQ